MLVSAIETAAYYWRNAEDLPVERMKVSKLDLFKLLQNAGVPGLPEQVAQIIAPLMGATKKFIDFIINFLPVAPSPRPPIFAQVSWERRSMKEALHKIYGYRSEALHGGTPFPAPMCMAPYKYKQDDKWEAPAEKMDARMIQTKGGAWLEKDTPMLLCTFEYLARGALLKWWQSLMLSAMADADTAGK
jgi:hypothetical protein